MIQLSELWNSRCRVQYSGRKIWKLIRFAWYLLLESFRGRWERIQYQNCKIADPICRTENMETDLICLKFVIRGFSGSLKMDRRQNFKIQNGGSNMVNWKCEWSKYDSVVRITRFEMANLMWWPENVKIYLIFLILVSRGFLETLITNLNSE